MTVLTKARRALALAAVALALALALAAACAVPPASAWAEEGAVDLGIDVSTAQPAPGSGEPASVGLGIALGLVKEDAPAAGGDAGSVGIGLAVAYDRVAEDGWYIRLDANNGTNAAAFKGSVSPGRVGVPRDGDYDKAVKDNGGTPPDGVSAPAGAEELPDATRPGYAFCGWYWAEVGADGATETDGYGRAVLDEGRGPVVLDDLTYDFLKERAGETLYAKWELAPGVRLLLTDAQGPDAMGSNKDDVHVWYWPGRGYALERPEADFEAAGALYDAPGVLPLVVYQRPTPASKLFEGWGEKGSAAGSGLDGELFVSHDYDGDANRDTYALTDAAFEEGFWEEMMYSLVDADGDGWVEYSLFVVGSPVTIRVAAPFRVVFDKGAGEGGEELAYSPDELVWSEGEAQWIESAPQEFANYTGREVYVSGLECVDAGASSLLPGGRSGAAIFQLHRGSRGDGSYAAGSAISFGYAEGADSVAIDWASAGRTGCLVLDGSEDAGEGGAVTSLRFALDLKAAQFSKSAMAVGNGLEAGDSRYTAGLANVKYTYALVP